MLARLGGVLYRTRWIVMIAAFVLVASAATFGCGVFNSSRLGASRIPPVNYRRRKLC